MRTSKLDKEFENLEALGGDSVSDARKVLEEEKKAEEEQKFKELTILGDAAKGRIVTYNILLARLLVKKLMAIDWGLWTFKVAPTEVGIILELQSPGGRFFRSAFKPTGEKKYDLNAIETYVVRAENTIDRIERRDVSGGEKES